MYRESNLKCIETLGKELETLKLEKDRLDGKLVGLLKASKNLDNLIESQRSDKTDKQETPKKPQVKYAEQYRHSNKKHNSKGNQKNWNNLKSYQLGKGYKGRQLENHAYMSPSHRSAGHRPHGAPMRPPHRSDSHRPHGASMRPSHRPAGHRPHGPSMNPMRLNMN
nr:hypothetical protein [Tanacetum cinerariifolium]